MTGSVRVPEIGLAVRWPGQAPDVDLVSLARLLAALDASPRMAAAADELEVSYRTAWGRVVAAERALGFQLVDRVKGHGSRLTPAGRELVAAVGHFERDARKRLAAPAEALAGRLANLAPASTPASLNLAASHDLLLQRCVAERRVDGLTIRFVGSEDALAALARGEADLAGFHRPAGERPQPPASPDGEPGFALALAQREQGLIVARGNPLRIRDVADLARPGLRFVNRQRGAATRVWLDRLLREGGIRADRIAGYDVEEPTHLAVAATVAAGAADAGFGLRAAADRFDLGFVPIGIETYWLAGRSGLRRDRRVRALTKSVREMAANTTGYGTASSR